jgi:hypothetical protein
MQLRDRYERPCRLLFSLLGESVAPASSQGVGRIGFLTDKIFFGRWQGEIALCEGGCILFVCRDEVLLDGSRHRALPYIGARGLPEKSCNFT